MNGSEPAERSGVTQAPTQTLPQGRPVFQDPRRKSPALACFLSAMPGLGQVYVGYYKHGFTNALVVASIITLLGAEVLGDEAVPLLSIFLAFFILYNIVDAGRRATFYNQVLSGVPGIEMPEGLTLPGPGGSLAGGAALIAGGTLLLLHTAFDVPLEWLEQWWPLAWIALGAFLLFKGLHERKRSRG
jgi:hypothetical protein